MYNIKSVLKTLLCEWVILKKISFNFVTEKMHCKIIGYTNIKDSDQTAHLRISDVNISIKDSGGGSWLKVKGWWRWGTLKNL